MRRRTRGKGEGRAGQRGEKEIFNKRVSGTHHRSSIQVVHISGKIKNRHVFTYMRYTLSGYSAFPTEFLVGQDRA